MPQGFSVQAFLRTPPPHQKNRAQKVSARFFDFPTFS